MTKPVILIFFVLLCSCHQSTPKRSGNSEDKLTASPSRKEDSVYTNDPKEVSLPVKPKGNTDNVINRKADSGLIKLAVEILRFVKTRNYKKLASFIHPEYGIRFSPFAYIDTTDDRKFYADELLLLAKQGKRINWNSSWDSERSPEFLTIDQYFKRYVYDVDFLNAELISLNKFHTPGHRLEQYRKGLCQL